MAENKLKYERGRDTQADLLAENKLKYERGRDVKSDELAASEVAYNKSRDVISDQQIAYNKQRNIDQDKIKAEALSYQKMKDAREQGLVDEAKQYEFDYDESIVNGAKGKAARLNTVIDDLVTFIGSRQGRWGLPSTGFGAETISSIGGTDAKSVANKLTEIKSIVGIDNLIDIKSKGGTFGALSDRELEVITAIFGSMDIGDPNLADNLEKVKISYGNISTDMDNLFKKKYPGKFSGYEQNRPAALEDPLGIRK